MAFSIVSKESSSIANSNTQSSADSARERAIARLLAPAAPVDQQAVTPEMMAAVSPDKAPNGAEAQGKPAPQVKSPVESDTSEPSPEATKEEPPLSAQYAQLARKEKALRAQMLDLKRQKEEFQREKQSVAPAVPQAPSIDTSKYVSRDDLAKDPWAVLNDIGVTYDSLTQQALNQPAPELLELRKTNAVLQSQIEELKKDFQESKKASTEQQAQAYQQAVAQISADVSSLVDSDAAYELVKATKSEKDVVQLITDTYAEEKRLMTIEEAAKEVEDFLLETLAPVARLSKIQQRIAANKDKKEAPVSAPKTETEQKQNTKTLTNSISTNRPMSARERAIAAFQGNR